MAEQRSEVGISNREQPEQEAHERQRHPVQNEGETLEPSEPETGPRDVQTSGKSGTRASARKNASTRHTDHPAPASSKVQGAFGKE